MAYPTLALIGCYLIRFGHEEFGKGLDRLVRIIKKPNQRQARAGQSFVIIGKKANLITEPTTAVSLDAKKAYDNTEYLLKTLNKFIFHSNFINYI